MTKKDDSKKDLVEMENLDVEPLTDDDLESVAGGAYLAESCSNCLWCSDCTDLDQDDSFDKR